MVCTFSFFRLVVQSDDKRAGKGGNLHDSLDMGYQMLHFSYRRVMISSRVVQHVSRCRGQQIIAKRVFSQTARAGDIVTGEDHGSGFTISRAPSKRKALVRSVAAPRYNPTAAGETVVGDLIYDIKMDLQRLQDASQPKASLTHSDPPSKSQGKKASQKGKDDHSSSTAPKVSSERKSLPSPRQFSIVSPDPKHTVSYIRTLRIHHSLTSYRLKNKY